MRMPFRFKTGILFGRSLARTAAGCRFIFLRRSFWQPRSRRMLIGTAIVAPFGVFLYPPNIDEPLTTRHSSTVAQYDANFTVSTIMVLNSIVFVLWQQRLFHTGPARKAGYFLRRNFLVDVRTAFRLRRWHTHLTYVFSHQTPFHLLLNSWMLWIIGGHIHEAVGRENFMAIYFGGGAFGSLCHVAWERFMRRGKALDAICGASAAVYAIIAAYFLHTPATEVTLDTHIPFYPEFTANKYITFLSLGCYELYGLLRGGGTIAHAAHLGGGLFGLLSMPLLSSARGTKENGSRLLNGNPYEGPLKNFYPTGQDGVLHTMEGDYSTSVQADRTIQLVKISEGKPSETIELGQK